MDAKRLAVLRRPSAAFVLQVAACAIVGWTVWHGGLASDAPAANSNAQPDTQTSAAAAAAQDVAPVAQKISLAEASPLAPAQLALSTIDVTVTRNDTLDRIFRRL